MRAVTADVMRGPLRDHAHDLARVATLSGGDASAAAIDGLTQLALRVAPAVVDRLPFEVPLGPNTAAKTGAIDVLWLGPDEWLVVAPDSPSTIARDIGDAVAGEHHAVVDVSANRAVIELGGPRRRSLLSSRCPLDLHPRAWRPGACAQTLLGKCPVLLRERSEDTWLFVRPSFAGYVVDLLVDAAAMRRA